MCQIQGSKYELQNPFILLGLKNHSVTIQKDCTDHYLDLSTYRRKCLGYQINTTLEFLG